MDSYRRSIVAAAGAATVAPVMGAWADVKPQQNKLVLSDFSSGTMLPGVTWRGFSDRVMGGVSNAELNTARIGGKNCIRLSGNVTRENNGGFIQMAMYFGRNYAELNGSDYRGVELLVYGNNEKYNVHIRTSDCSWHDQSYRMTFFAETRWQRIQIPWETFEGNRIGEPLDSAKLQRIAVLGWMREFEADIALAEISLYS